MIKQPIKFDTEVPNGNEIEFLLKYFVIIYLIEHPIPPPKKTRTIDFKSNFL